MPETSTLPASLESERAVLGCILQDNKHYLEAVEGLNADDFSVDAHRRIFRRMCDLMDSGRPVDMEALIEELSIRKDLVAVGDVAYLSSLRTDVMERKSIAHLVQIVRDKSMLRNLIHVSNTAIARAEEQQDSALNIVADTEAEIARIAGKPKSQALSVREIIPTVITQMESERARTSDLAGFSTGIKGLDEATGGVRKSELWIVGALPGRGKTALGLQIGTVNAFVDVPVAVFSLEMTREQLIRRQLAALTVAGNRVRDPKQISDENWERVKTTAEKLKTLPLYVDDSASLNIRELCARARMYKKKFGIKLLIVDYLRLVTSTGKDLKEQVGNIANALRQLAKDEGLSVIALSQLRRPSNLNDRPTMIDLKESGDIEAHANTVLLIYQPIDMEENQPTGEDEIIIGKQRNGPLSHIPVVFDKTTLMFKPRWSEAEE